MSKILEKQSEKNDKENFFDYRKIDEILHSRIRLSIVSVLARVDHAEFQYLKQQIKTTDGNLSVHCGKLEKIGYIRSKKIFINRKPSTSYKITEAGKKALLGYAQKLAELTLFQKDK